MELFITKDYLWIPVKRQGEKTAVRIFLEGAKQHEFIIETGKEKDFYVYLPIHQWKERQIEIICENEEIAAQFLQCETKPDSFHKKRPLIHYTPAIGWMNDPNGLIYHMGEYHMAYQHNPYGVNWNNMHWGHAKSKDLVSWEEMEEVIYPDEYGTAFSGCAVEDFDNRSGLGNHALLYYYTVSTNNETWGSDRRYEQRIKYSTDKGITFKSLQKEGVSNLRGDNRDPKIFYYSKEDKYCMVLYLEQNDFALLESYDLLQWKLLQIITLPQAWECPDLLELPIENSQGESKWIFWTADGFYFLGDFNGREFKTDGVLREAYATRLPYAAQTYYGLKDRIISQGWLRVPNQGGLYTGVMALPAELKLVELKKEYYLKLWPIKEMESIRRNPGRFDFEAGQRGLRIDGIKGAFELILHFGRENSGVITVDLLGSMLTVDLLKKKISFTDQEANFIASEEFSIRIIADYGVLEIYIAEGLTYFPCVFDIEMLEGNIMLETNGQVMIDYVEYFELKR